MAYRRRRGRSFPGHNDRPTLNNVDHLSLKYMEMCKMESSTDSDSEISPRWSDTSTMGYASSAPESGTSRRSLTLTQKPPGRQGGYSTFLDPYDGSSEDSEESSVEFFSRQMRPQGKGVGGGSCRLSGCGQRFVFCHPASARMKCGSDSEPSVSECYAFSSANRPEVSVADPAVHIQTMDVELQLDASGIGSTTPRSQNPGNGSAFQMLPSSSDRSLGSLHKRKVGLTGAEELQQRKRQYVFAMEDE